MVYTYLVSIIAKYMMRYPEKAQRLQFNELSDFIYGTLWGKHGLSLWEGKMDLLGDLLLGKKLGLWNLYGDAGVNAETDGFGDRILKLPTGEGEFFNNLAIEVTNMEQLRECEKITEDSAKTTGVQLMKEYSSRINDAIRDLP